MNRFLYLITLLLLPVLALGQSTATLDGSYISNMRSSPNFVVNPNCQKNTYAVVSAAGSTISRSTTTPIAAGTECNVADANAWEARWGVRTVDAGMSNRLCEVGMTLRGAASGTTTLQVLDNTTPVFTQTVTLDATNPKRIGGTFPCGATLNQFSVLLSGTGAITQTIEAGAVYLGEPVSVSSGTVSTEWQSYTPTITSGEGTIVSTKTGRYRRDGSDVIVQAEYAYTSGTGAAATFELSLPSGLSALSGQQDQVVGNAFYYNNAGGFKGAEVRSDGTNSVYFTKDSAVAFIAGTDADEAGSAIRMIARVPISGWAATDIVTPEASLVEYACTNGTWDANDSTVYRGSDGCVMGGTLTAARTKTITWQKAAVASDSQTIEMSTDRVVWFDAIGNSPYTISSGGTADTSAGIYLIPNAVIFLKYRFIANDDSPATEWPNSLYWRIKKAPSSGSQSFYISSPLVAPPDGTGIKLKSSTNVDLMTINDTTGAASIGASSAATGGHTVRANNTIPLAVKNNDTAANSFMQFANGTGILGYSGFNASTGYRILASNGSTDWGGSGTSGNWTFGATGGTETHNFNGSIKPTVGYKGTNTGTAIPAGYVGESACRVSPSSTTTTLGTAEADVAGLTCTLNKGTYIIGYSITVTLTTGATSGNILFATTKITNSSNTELVSSARRSALKTVAAVANESYGVHSFTDTIQIASDSTVVKVRAFRTDGAGTNIAEILNAGGSYSNFYAIRLD